MTETLNTHRFAWHRIEQTLLAEIAAGSPQAGSRLPGEFDLAERFGVNRHTARRAVGALVDRGVVRIERGVGAFIAERSVLDYAIGRRTRFRQNLTAADRRPERQVLAHRVVGATGLVAKALAVRAGLKVWDIHLLGLADGQALSVGSLYAPHRRFPHLVEHLVATGGITEALSMAGVHDYTRRSTRVGARLPTETEAAFLQQSQAMPVLITESVDVDQSGRAVTYSHVAFAAARIQFVVDAQ